MNARPGLPRLFTRFKVLDHIKVLCDPCFGLGPLLAVAPKNLHALKLGGVDDRLPIKVGAFGIILFCLGLGIEEHLDELVAIFKHFFFVVLALLRPASVKR
jgi:hypothetical protein